MKKIAWPGTGPILATVAILVLVISPAGLTGGGLNGGQAYGAEPGKLTGGIAHSYPDWFKESFLDFKEDASEAADEGKHTILFMSLNGCPYCARMLNETFVENRALMEKDFDTIGLNIRGDRMISTDGENEITEKQMARKMRVRFTPTTVFLDDKANTVLRINGYWDPAQFRVALAYVRSKSYKTMSISEFSKARKLEKIWDFRAHELMSDKTDLSAREKPLLVLFEDAGCSACGELHEKMLSRDDVKEVLKTYDFVRLDSRSSAEITDYDGNKTTPDKWAARLGISTSPTFVAFDEGKERQRFDGLLYSHHFISILAYVSGKHYKTYDNWLKFNSKRTQEVLKSGKNIDLSDGTSGAGE